MWKAVEWPAPLKPLFSLAVHAKQRADEVKLSGALGRLVDEDPSLSFNHDEDAGGLLLWGLGEMQLNIALDRVKNRYNVDILADQPRVPYKETIRGSVSQHARHKKQSGGHGEFGDVHLDIKPLPRGSGFDFSSVITGGVVPKQYIPAVETGAKEYMQRGPLGFPVVDVAVTLTDGQFHSVDSSDMAFRKAGAMAMREGMPKMLAGAAGAYLRSQDCPSERVSLRVFNASSAVAAAKFWVLAPKSTGKDGTRFR